MQLVHLGADDTVALALDQAGDLGKLGRRMAPVPLSLDRQDVTGVAAGHRATPGCFATGPVRHDPLPATVVRQRNLGVFFNGLRIKLHGHVLCAQARPRRSEHRSALQGQASGSWSVDKAPAGRGVGGRVSSIQARRYRHRSRAQPAAGSSEQRARRTART